MSDNKDDIFVESVRELDNKAVDSESTATNTG